MRQSFVPILAAFAFLAAPAFAADKYDIDPGHSQILFGWNHFGFSNLTARFAKFDGELMLDTEDLTRSTVSVTIPLDSIDSGVVKLDQHLRSPDFFDTAKNPNATFTSTSVERVSDKALKVHGDLTIHGVTQPVVLDVTVNQIGKHPMSGKQSAGFDATVTVKRSAFKVDKYAPNVSDDIWIRITTESNKAGQAPAAK